MMRRSPNITEKYNISVRVTQNAAFKVRCIHAAMSISLILWFSTVLAQTGRPAVEFVPMPDPGYSLYYRDSDTTPKFAERWGYHDGWEDGRHDRNHGDMFNASDKDRYKLPPDHGGHPGIARDEYNKAYRVAYGRGYQHGSRL